MIKLDVLRKFCTEGLPTKNIYDSAAEFVLEYEKIVKKSNETLNSSQNRNIK